MRFKGLFTAAAMVVVVAALSACTTAAGAPAGGAPAGGSVIAPVTMSANSLQGADVDLVVGQMLNVTTGDLAVDSYRGTVADTDVAVFTAGRTDGSAVFNPGIQAMAVGTTAVTLTNSNGGIQPLTFTVTVTSPNR
ncbi:hypothetical protein [Herbiconiux solani]|uniref:hypothetical protein n=1 Tax=Herbiconiux solani TaxID=661329 RepID=UPI00082464E9|nr:hypothetical protein [Herbiconiux solani]